MPTGVGQRRDRSGRGVGVGNQPRVTSRRPNAHAAPQYKYPSPARRTYGDQPYIAPRPQPRPQQQQQQGGQAHQVDPFAYLAGMAHMMQPPMINFPEFPDIPETPLMPIPDDERIRNARRREFARRRGSRTGAILAGSLLNNLL